MITTKGKTMNRLAEFKQKPPAFGLKKRCSRRLIARGLETKTRSRRAILLLLFSTLFWATSCEEYHSSVPGYYAHGSYREGNPADFLEHDRIYYRGPEYWSGGAYYIWEPGYWAFRTGASPSRGPGLGGGNGALPNPGQLLWIHGRYIAQETKPLRLPDAMN